MSCISRIDVLILDLDAFQKACAELGMQFVQNKSSYRTDDGNHKCEHAVMKVGLLREVGLIRARFNKDRKRIEATEAGEGWTITLDTFGAAGRQITDVVGTKCEKLMKSYGCHVVRNKATQMGWSIKEESLQDGVVFTCRPKHQQQKASW